MEKRIILTIIISLFLMGCVPPIPRYVEQQSTVIVQDLRGYSSKGFLFSPDPYRGDHTAIASIYIKAVPEVRAGKKDGEFYRPIDQAALIQQIYEKAVSMGANAIVNFKIEVATEEPEYYPTPTPATIISGFAIKRK